MPASMVGGGRVRGGLVGVAVSGPAGPAGPGRGQPADLGSMPRSSINVESSASGGKWEQHMHMWPSQ